MVIILAKKKPQDDSRVFIGRKKSMNYVLAAMMVINENRPVRLLARGRSISKAVDVAEILKNNGVDLFEYISPQGRTLRQAFDRIAEWTEKPELFPYWKGDPKALGGVKYFSYFEILNARWPNAAATRLLKKSRPMSARHSAPFLTLTHGGNLKQRFK